MTEQSRLDGLLLRYEALRDQGMHVLPEEVCNDCPELLEQLKREIRIQKSMDVFLAGADSEAASAGTTKSDLALPDRSAPWSADALRTGSRYQVLRFHAK